MLCNQIACTLQGFTVNSVLLFVSFDSLNFSQQFFSYVRTGFPGMKQYLARINVSCSSTQHNDAGEAQTHFPLVLSQALYN